MRWASNAGRLSRSTILRGAVYYGLVFNGTSSGWDCQPKCLSQENLVVLLDRAGFLRTASLKRVRFG